ncbi:MAG TPA: hypothetical protein VHM00_07400 [Caldimonas sp.]|jgi:hypothetical protein|nr:hypothetical protein [Caldimonas sp.]HEX2540893.1 hypothetical protein [Caldimonas sp.]
MHRFVLAFVAACSLAGPAAAQVQRVFPATALRGAIVIGEAPEIALNNRPARLAPGARIRDANNMSVVPSGLMGGKFLVHYTVDTSGLVKDVWILRPDEAAVRPWPTTPGEARAWTFDPAAQVWIKP